METHGLCLTESHHPEMEAGIAYQASLEKGEMPHFLTTAEGSQGVLAWVDRLPIIHL